MLQIISLMISENLCIVCDSSTHAGEAGDNRKQNVSMFSVSALTECVLNRFWVCVFWKAELPGN